MYHGDPEKGMALSLVNMGLTSLNMAALASDAQHPPPIDMTHFMSVSMDVDES